MKDLNVKFMLSDDTKIGFDMDRAVIHVKKITRSFLDRDIREREKRKFRYYCGGKMDSN